MCARGKRLDVLDLGLADIAQVRDLVEPHPSKRLLLVTVPLPENCLIGKVLWSASQSQKRCALVFPFRTFQHNDLVELAAGALSAAHLCDQRYPADGAIQLGILGAEIRSQPFVDALDPVPLQGVEIINNRIKSVFRQSCMQASCIPARPGSNPNSCSIISRR